MTQKKNPEEDLISVAIGRQPIFDAKRRLWGYELFGVGRTATTGAGLPEEADVAASVASSAYMGLQHVLDRGKKVFVNFNEKSILDNLPYALPPVLVAVKVEEHLYKRSSVAELLHRLKSDGYLIAVAGFSGDPVCDPLYRLADIIGIEVAHQTRDALAAPLASARSYRALLLASRVEDPRRLKLCQELGFSLFHGAFFKSPDKITIRKLSSHEVSRLSLLQSIEKDEPDMGQLAEAIQADVSISFRLLAYLNSAAFGFPQKIRSIQHALALLGWRQMKNWLRVVLLADMSQSQEAYELVWLSAQRGKFLELITREHDFWGFDPESLNLLGLFSLLDTLLGSPMTEIVSYLPLDHKLKAALCREPNNEYLRLLELAQYFEEGRWVEGEKTIQQLNLDSHKVKAAFQISLNWTTDLAALHSAPPGGD
ncbi:MAG: HDOD domain-containing protein [Desulfobacterales bacterium]|nr:MAG: HDOD domain-containing protein [Desulfobacterales bacterium]